MITRDEGRITPLMPLHFWNALEGISNTPSLTSKRPESSKNLNQSPSGISVVLSVEPPPEPLLELSDHLHKSRDPRVSCLNPRKTSRDLLQHVSRPDSPTAVSRHIAYLCLYSLEMATHSSVLAWRIPGTGEPGGLPSLGSHRVRHD